MTPQEPPRLNDASLAALEAAARRAAEYEAPWNLVTYDLAPSAAEYVGMLPPDVVLALVAAARRVELLEAALRQIEERLDVLFDSFNPVTHIVSEEDAQAVWFALEDARAALRGPRRQRNRVGAMTTGWTVCARCPHVADDHLRSGRRSGRGAYGECHYASCRPHRFLSQGYSQRTVGVVQVSRNMAPETAPLSKSEASSLNRPRTEAGRRLLAREALNTRSFALITVDAILAIEAEAVRAYEPYTEIERLDRPGNRADGVADAHEERVGG